MAHDMARICSHCEKQIQPGKGCTLHYYMNCKEEAFECCGTDCADAVKDKMKAKGYGRPGVK